jgi:DNA-binding CsgD family transcriptional regulator
VYDAEEDAQNAYWISHRMRGFAERAGDRSLAFSAQTNMYAIDAVRGNEERLRESESRIVGFEGEQHARATGVLASSYALQATWHGDFAAAHAMLAGSAGEQSSPSRRAARWAELGLYAAAAGEREAAETALRAFAAENEAVVASGENAPRLWRGRLVAALAGLVMGKAATAHRILGGLEQAAATFTPALRALLSATRALYVHLETGASLEELKAALDHLRSAGGGGYATLLEHLPLPESPTAGGFATLTKAELAVLRSLARGGTSKSVAFALGRSPQTVDTHVKAIVKKLGCRRRHEAIARAVEAGLV